MKRGKVLIAVFNADRDFQQYVAGIFNVPGKTQYGNHTVAIVGYDEAAKSIKIANSWGKNWGEGGFARIDIAILVGRTFELYVIDGVTLLSH